MYVVLTVADTMWQYNYLKMIAKQTLPGTRTGCLYFNVNYIRFFVFVVYRAILKFSAESTHCIVVFLYILHRDNFYGITVVYLWFINT